MISNQQAVSINLYRFQFKDEIKAARKSATKAYRQYVEEPITSQRRYRLEMELELPRDIYNHAIY